MKAVISKSELKQAISAVSKIANPGKAGRVYVIVDENQNFSVVASNEAYIKYNIGADNTEPGGVAFNFSLFENFAKIIGDNLSFEKKENVVRVKGGTTHEFYYMNYEDDEIDVPEVEGTRAIKVPSKGIGILKDILSKAHFSDMDGEPTTFAVLDNSEESLKLKFADSVHCAFYTCKDRVSKKDFSLAADFSRLQTVIPFIDESVKLKIGDSSILLSGDKVVTDIPLAQNEMDAVESAEGFFSEENFEKGYLEFNIKDLTDKSESVGVGREGNDILKISAKNKKVALDIRSSFGKSKGTFSGTKNTLGKFEIEIPMLMFDDILKSSKQCESMKLYLNSEKKYYKTVASTDDVKIRCIGPISGS